jgi:hypothetical protein
MTKLQSFFSPLMPGSSLPVCLHAKKPAYPEMSPHRNV